MTLRKIAQLHKIVMNIPNYPRNLRLINAYTDQALINFNYETNTKDDQKECLRLITAMIAKFNLVRGR